MAKRTDRTMSDDVKRLRSAQPTSSPISVIPTPRSARRELRLAYALNEVIARRRMTQEEAAEKLGINQPKVSALANYKLGGFSVERLMTLLTALDQDVEIVIRKKKRSRTAGRISVIAG